MLVSVVDPSTSVSALRESLAAFADELRALNGRVLLVCAAAADAPVDGGHRSSSSSGNPPSSFLDQLEGPAPFRMCHCDSDAKVLRIHKVNPAAIASL